jgi:hypothetical protein
MNLDVNAVLRETRELTELLGAKLSVPFENIGEASAGSPTHPTTSATSAGAYTKSSSGHPHPLALGWIHGRR